MNEWDVGNARPVKNGRVPSSRRVFHNISETPFIRSLVKTIEDSLCLRIGQVVNVEMVWIRAVEWVSLPSPGKEREGVRNKNAIRRQTNYNYIVACSRIDRSLFLLLATPQPPPFVDLSSPDSRRPSVGPNSRSWSFLQMHGARRRSLVIRRRSH